MAGQENRAARPWAPHLGRPSPCRDLLHHDNPLCEGMSSHALLKLRCVHRARGHRGNPMSPRQFPLPPSTGLRSSPGAERPTECWPLRRHPRGDPQPDDPARRVDQRLRGIPTAFALAVYASRSGVAPTPRKTETGFRLVASPCRTGLATCRVSCLVPRHPMTTVLHAQALPGAIMASTESRSRSTR
jgi:hypothetical protein